MNSVGDSFAWPFQDPGWFGKMILQGLIGIIPIIGWIAAAGWMMLTIDNYRAGRRELPPAGFHLGRGAGIFFVYLIYSIVLAIPGGLITGLGGAGNSGALAPLGNLIDFVLRLFLLFLAPAIILFTYRGGFSGGFDLNGIWRMATGSTTNTLLAGLVILVANIIGGLGAILCLVGLLFTIPYGLAITAGVVTWYEQVMAGPARVPPPGATA
jgi:Protein of unknown function (DUF4013)